MVIVKNYVSSLNVFSVNRDYICHIGNNCIDDQRVYAKSEIIL